MDKKETAKKIMGLGKEDTLFNAHKNNVPTQAEEPMLDIKMRLASKVLGKGAKNANVSEEV